MKVERLLAIVIMLLNKRRMSASELARHFEVSLRTIYRDLEAINTAGIPIVAYPGSNGGYEIMESFTIDRQYLSFEELSTVLAALKGVQTSISDKQVQHLLEKIKTLITNGSEAIGARQNHPIVYDFNPWGSTEESMRRVNQLREAIENRLRVTFVYSKLQGEQVSRTVEPITLVLKGYVWYLYGYCLWRQAYRLFRLSRMSSVTTLAEHFQPHPSGMNALKWLEEWNSTDQISLVLEFSPSVAVRVRDMFRPEAVTAKENGMLVVQTQVADDEWLYGMLLSFGDSLRVVEPDRVRHRLYETVKKMVASYESSQC